MRSELIPHLIAMGFFFVCSFTALASPCPPLPSDNTPSAGHTTMTWQSQWGTQWEPRPRDEKQAGGTREYFSPRQVKYSGVVESQFLMIRGEKFETEERGRGRSLLEKIRAQQTNLASVGFNENSPKALPPRTPQVKDSNDCVRDMTPADLPNIGKTLTVLIDYSAFDEVAMLAKFDEERQSYIKLCSAVIVGPRHAISARHCFFRTPSDTSERDFILLFGLKGNRNAGGDLNDCKPLASEGCLFRVVRVGSPMFPDSELVENPLSPNKEIIAPDIALLPFEVIPSSPVTITRTAELKAVDVIPITQDGLSASHWLTFIGFGLSQRAADHELSGGYWSSDQDVTVAAGGFAVLVNDAQHQTRPCSYDSGGPVFFGPYTGGESERRIVSGVMSLAANAQARDTCASSSRSVVQLLTHAALAWICSKAASVAGCPSE